ncbi:unnamed protein product [Paramecium pentaurelia]|uniref:Uncharacterized protein n=1 Tax=Paramecium pentaurelia TaxID=43138 RepID=A0A8S1SK53_9CILI|nr:unnamed protein product [Paramecium pentaurelia]
MINKICTPIHLSVKKGHDQVITLLFESDSNIQAVDERSWTPLHYASFYQNRNVVHLLNKYDADEDRYYAIRTKLEEKIILLSNIHYQRKQIRHQRTNIVTVLQIMQKNKIIRRLRNSYKDNNDLLIQYFIMFFEFGFFFIVIILGEEIVYDVKSACRCQQILSEGDCNQKCKWNTDKKKCYDRKCYEIEDEEACFIRNCNYIDNQCQNLDSCSDILVKFFCNLSSKCIYDDSTQNCREEIVQEQNCDSFFTKNACSNYVDSNNNYCVWIDNDVDEGYVQQPGHDYGSCKSYPFQTCDSANLVFNPKELCERNRISCMWLNDSCQQKDCLFIGNDEQLCKNSFASIKDGDKTLLCSWNALTQQCENGFDISTLKQEECYSEQTLFQLTFDDSKQKCTKCPGIGMIVMCSLLIQLIFL